jgi:hypothetical protein
VPKLTVFLSAIVILDLTTRCMWFSAKKAGSNEPALLLIGLI